MNLINKFKSYPLIELIKIAEVHTDYTDEAKSAALEIIHQIDQNTNPDLVKVASIYWETYLIKNIKSMLINNKIPKSHFLNEDLIKKMMRDAYNKWKEQQELLGIDITKYWAIGF